MEGKIKPTVDEILTSLTNEVLFGKAYLRIAKGLAGADPVVLNTSRTFFGLTVEGGLQMSQMFAAKLYDKTSGAVTMKSLLETAKSQAGLFEYGSPQEVSAAVSDAESRIAGLLPILKSVQDRRNQALAHLDPRTVKDPTNLDINAKLTLSDLEKVFAETGIILNEFSRLWKDTTSMMELIGDDDFTSALDLIADAKHAQADKYEAEFKEPYPYSRPQKPKSQW